MNHFIEKEIFQEFKRTLSENGVGVITSVQLAKSLSKSFMQYAHNHVPSGCKDNLTTFAKLINSDENIQILNDLGETFTKDLSKNKVSGDHSKITLELVNNVLKILNAGAIELAEKKSNREKFVELMEKGKSSIGTGITKRLTSPT